MPVVGGPSDLVDLPICVRCGFRAAVFDEPKCCTPCAVELLRYKPSAVYLRPAVFSYDEPVEDLDV